MMDSLDCKSSFIDDDSIVGYSDESTDDSPVIYRSKKINKRVISDSDEENDSSVSNSVRSNPPDKSLRNSDQKIIGLAQSQPKLETADKLRTCERSLSTSGNLANSSAFSTVLKPTRVSFESTTFSSSLRDLSHKEVAQIRISESDDNSISDFYIRNSLSPKLIEETDDEDDSVIEVLSETSILNISSQSENSPGKMPNKMVPKTCTTEQALKPKVETDIEVFMPQLPDSVPNSKKMYVQKEVRENELKRLAVLQVDLHELKSTMDYLNIEKLPDGGKKLQQRYASLMVELRKQKELVSNMVVAEGEPTEEDLRNDGFDLWDQIQKESAKVESQHLGKQGMNTHNVQMNYILNALRAMNEDLSTRPDKKDSIKEPNCLKVALLPHQNQALAWLLWRESKFPHGGILADDMGLGKTLTMIALIARSKYDDEMKDDDDEEKDKWVSRNNKHMLRGGTLVVCPASLLSHWEGEIKTRIKKYHFTVLLHHGSKREDRPHKLAKADIVITTYNLISKDLDRLLGKISWRRIILDEAHVVRNSKSLTAKSVCSLTGKNKWCLTGTPVHNKNLDLYALIQFLGCPPFDDIQVWKKWIDNKSAGAQERLSLITKCLMLRRTKEQLRSEGELKDLPDKKYQEIELELSKQEMAVYQKVLLFSRNLFAQFLHQRAEKDEALHIDMPGESKEEYYKMHKKMIALHGGKKIKTHEILVLLLRLRQICCHPGLIATMLDSEDTNEAAGFEETPDEQCLDLLSKINSLNIHEDKASEEPVQEIEDNNDGATIAEAMRSVLSPSNPVFNLQNPSSKMQAVLKCLYENVFTKNGDRAILVSQWTSLLSVFETHLKSDGIKCSSITGKVPVPLRAEVVEKFNNPDSDLQVLLLSLCAGGVGLNLIGGNHLLLLDLHWNPQLEVQAQDRIYRVGQKKPVFVYRFWCLETIEQKIKQLQDIKMELAKNVLTGAKHESSGKLTLKEMKSLLDFY